jgi:hypothetical protein
LRGIRKNKWSFGRDLRIMKDGPKINKNLICCTVDVSIKFLRMEVKDHYFFVEFMLHVLLTQCVKVGEQDSI